VIDKTFTEVVPDRWRSDIKYSPIMSKILLKDGQVGCALGVYDAHVLIEGGKIVDTYDWDKTPEADEIIDCKGKLILPGLIDAHVHLREPGHAYKEDWETGSSAAVAGGVTTVLDMPNNKPPVVSVADLEAKRKLIKGRSYCNYGLYIGFDGKNLHEVNASDAVAVKFYACDSTGDMGVTDSKEVEELFEKSNKLIVVHAEDASCLEEKSKLYLAEFEGGEVDPAVHSKIRGPECAIKAVKAVCDLAKKHGSRLHIAHLSTEGELDIVNEHKDVTCEVAPHHLLLCDDDYETLGNFLRVNPPVRNRTDIFALWKGLKFGEIDIIATDHAPHTIEEKEQPYLKVPSGVPELDTLGPILFNAINDEGLEVAEVVKLCCEGPARIFGLKGKGQIEPGFDADLVVVDMEKEGVVKREALFSKCGWSPYEGMHFKGWPLMTFVNGELVFKNGKIVGKKLGKEVEIG